MVDFALFVQGGDWLCSGAFAPTGVNQLDWCVPVYRHKCVTHHVATLVRFRNDTVSLIGVIGGDCGPSPFVWCASQGAVVQHIAFPVWAYACDDYACFVAVRSAGCCWVYCDDDTTQRWVLVDAVLIEHGALPQCAFQVVQDFSV
jgi:hypothetical protein